MILGEKDNTYCTLWAYKKGCEGRNNVRFKTNQNNIRVILKIANIFTPAEKFRKEENIFINNLLFLFMSSFLWLEFYTINYRILYNSLQSLKQIISHTIRLLAQAVTFLK